MQKGMEVLARSTLAGGRTGKETMPAASSGTRMLFRTISAQRCISHRSTLRWGSQRNAFDANPICHVTAIASPEEVCLA